MAAKYSSHHSTSQNYTRLIDVLPSSSDSVDHEPEESFIHSEVGTSEENNIELLPIPRSPYDSTGNNENQVPLLNAAPGSLGRDEVPGLLGQGFPSIPRESLPYIKVAENDQGISYNILVLGQPKVGKTSVILRLRKGNDFDVEQVNDGRGIAFDMVSYKDRTSPTYHKLKICEISGSKRLSSDVVECYQTCDAAILMFDVTNYATLQEISKWKEGVERHAKNKHILFLLAANKCDMDHKERIITNGSKLKDKFGNINGYFFTSAKTGKDIDELFIKALANAIEARRLKGGCVVL